ncbi:response regulator [Aquiflexum sp. TKW24L]|uniref:response regulator n=1 Tax=Aquiflexum sp. TKW24L TaxID=2942212 RepID=UPI0020BEE39C|nr:response regulator [Aquiflexum sp. TKW24L]MCL6261062.1 response regulator [Aquiflexum sp. TKW24L]
MKGNNRKLDCVLLIDDDEATNFYHTIVLEEECEGLYIQSVRSAKEGLDFLLRKGKYANTPQPGIIFLDINMPGMTGWDFIAKYNDLSADIHKRAVVAMLTTSDNPDDRQRASALPAVIEFVHKPLTAEIFRKVMEENFN